MKFVGAGKNKEIETYTNIQEDPNQVT